MVTQAMRNIYHCIAAITKFGSLEISEIISVEVSQPVMRHTRDKNIIALLIEYGSKINKLLGTVCHAMHKDDDTFSLASMRKQFRAADWIESLIRFFLSLYLRKTGHSGLIVDGWID